eukprot:883154-Pelagomonas_calceolata.AAC.1
MLQHSFSVHAMLQRYFSIHAMLCMEHMKCCSTLSVFMPCCSAISVFMPCCDYSFILGKLCCWLWHCMSKRVLLKAWQQVKSDCARLQAPRKGGSREAKENKINSLHVTRQGKGGTFTQRVFAQKSLNHRNLILVRTSGDQESSH